MNNNLAVKEIEFNGDKLVAGQDKNTNKVWVAVKVVCDGIGLNKNQRDRQVKNIREDLLLKIGASDMTLEIKSGGTGSVQNVLCLDLDFLPMWLAKISITPAMKKNNPFMVQKLIDYQLKAKDVLAQAFIHKNKPDFGSEYFNTIIESGMLNKLKNCEDKITDQNNHIILLENKYKELENRLSSSLGYRQIKVNPERVTIKNLVDNLTKQHHLRYGKVWARLDNVIKNKYNIDIQMRLQIALREIQKQHILDKGKPYSELTLKQKYNRMDILEEENLLKEAENIILDMF
jgi:hypothetical protein